MTRQFFLGTSTSISVEQISFYVKTILPCKTAQQTHETRHLLGVFKLQYCTKFNQLILRIIIKIVATRCHIFRIKCTRFDVGCSSAPNPAGGAHSAPPDTLTGFEGVLLLREDNGREGEVEGGGGKAKGKVASWLLGGWTPLLPNSPL